MISHLASKYVSHGQRVPEAVLTFLTMRLCGDPCKTLVPAGARCKNYLAGPKVKGSFGRQKLKPVFYWLKTVKDVFVSYKLVSKMIIDVNKVSKIIKGVF